MKVSLISQNAYSDRIDVHDNQLNIYIEVEYIYMRDTLDKTISTDVGLGANSLQIQDEKIINVR